ncbi:MAG TPA: DUF5317 family protein [Acidimicrobiales bacterium]|nr:DUF5317 family protein [Acidimicrobiales bacterium]
MRFTLLALAAGLAIGLVTGGRLSHLGSRGLRLWPLLLAGLALQPLSVRLDGGAATAALVGSYALLLAFALANVAVVGMWLVATGIALNLAVITVNSGMPVRPSALRAAGLVGEGAADHLRPAPTRASSPEREPVPARAVLAAKHHLERPSDRLVVLGDIIPVAPLREVVSFGDVAMAVGLADVVAHLLRPLAGRRARSPGGGDPVEAAGAGG